MEFNGQESAKLGFIARIPETAPVPDEFQVFPYGEVGVEGAAPFVVDEQAMKDVVEHFRDRGLDMVIDYEHQTEGGAQAPAAGWIRRLEDRGKDGLWAVVEWTDRARQYLSDREYRYYSPVFLISKQARRLSELLRVALTNAPRLNWIRPIVAKRIPTDEEFDMEFLQVLAKQLGLSGQATEQEVTAAVAKLRRQEGAEVCKEVLAALDLPDGTGKSEAVASIHVLRQRPDLSLEVAALKERLAARDRSEVVAAAVREGKITPAQREWAEKYANDDPEGFRIFVAKAPRVLPLDPVRTVPDRSFKPGAPDEDQLRINRLMNITEETWAKYN